MSVRPAVVAFVAMLAVGGCSPTAQPEPTAATPSEDVEAVADVLAKIVVAQDDPPTDTEFFQSFDGEFSGTQMVQESSLDVQDAVLEGWVDALTMEFASPETVDVIQGNASSDELAKKDHHFVGSLSSAYEDTASAQEALEVVLDESGKGAASEEGLTLGDGGMLFRRRFLGVASIALVWTSGRFLMVLTANGMDEDEIRSIAEAMQSRVPTS
jgi:hypothetical protein